MNENPHPWSIFLKSRADAMLWMRHERKKSDWQIARDLSMDEEQVYHILKNVEKDE